MPVEKLGVCLKRIQARSRRIRRAPGTATLQCPQSAKRTPLLNQFIQTSMPSPRRHPSLSISHVVDRSGNHGAGVGCAPEQEVIVKVPARALEVGASSEAAASVAASVSLGRMGLTSGLGG